MVTIHGELASIPWEDLHFTEIKTSSQDEVAGEMMAYEIGHLFFNWQLRSAKEQWVQVMKALRVHGFTVGFSSD